LFWSAAYWVAVPRGLHPLRPNRAVGVGREAHIHGLAVPTMMPAS
jgi:hypothetical protein